MSLAPFASAFDVAARWRPLTTDEASLADVLCGDASTLIRARFPGIDGQVDPGVLTIVVAGMVKRAMIAPSDGVSQESQGMGPYNQSRTFANPLQNVFLTAADLTLILGYVPTGGSFSLGNTTTNTENSGPGYVYGYGS